MKVGLECDRPSANKCPEVEPNRSRRFPQGSVSFCYDNNARDIGEAATRGLEKLKRSRPQTQTCMSPIYSAHGVSCKFCFSSGKHFCVKSKLSPIAGQGVTQYLRLNTGETNGVEESSCSFGLIRFPDLVHACMLVGIPVSISIGMT